jgi:hypothetical protein
LDFLASLPNLPTFSCVLEGGCPRDMPAVLRAALQAEAGLAPGAASTSAAAAAASLRHAFLLVEQVRQLAEQAQRQTPRPMGWSGAPLLAQHAASPPGTGPPGAEAEGVAAASPPSPFADALNRSLSWAGAGRGVGAGAEERAPLLRRLSHRTPGEMGRGAGAGGGWARVRDAVLGGLAAPGGGSSSRRLLMREDPTIANNPGLQ